MSSTPTPELLRRAVVGCRLQFTVSEPASIALQVAVARTQSIVDEQLEVKGGTGSIEPEAVALDHDSLADVFEAPVGPLSIHYEATVDLPPVAPGPPTPAELLTYLRQSRYCPADELTGFAGLELEGLTDPKDIAAWVHGRLRYELGSSGPTDTAIDTLLSGAGVCRDFAHMVVSLCRALDIPARLVSVYAPGLTPMDFHAVAEVAGPDGWEIVDATRLAPRPSLVRIATGRDAADTAFVSIFGGTAVFEESEVWAVVTEGGLPDDHHARPVGLR